MSPAGDKCPDPQVPQEHPNCLMAGSMGRPRVYSTVRCLGSRPPSDTNISLVAQTVKDLPARQETQVGSLGRSPGGGPGTRLQYSCPENPMDGRARGATVSGFTELDTTEHTDIHTH